mgnify:FL=1
MSAPIIDFSHLTPAERIELAQQLWESLEDAEITLDEAQLAELTRRRAELRSDRDPGQPWRDVLRDIARDGV